MAESVQEDLLGYLLGALDETERERVEQQLQESPRLQQQLARLRLTVNRLEVSRVRYEPPRALASRTCELVAADRATAAAAAAHVDESPVLLPIHNPLPEEAALAEPQERGFQWGRWRFADVAVAAGIFIAATALIVPAIQRSRADSQLAACRDNLRELGVALVQYADRNHGYFPRVPDQGPLAVAGIYAPTLVSGGFLDGSRWTVCPSSPLAAAGKLEIPALEELQSMKVGEALNRLRARMGGSYGYSLGYVENGRYYTTRNLHRPYFALMADAPSRWLSSIRSLNHPGGQNVLFEDGHSAFLTRPEPDQRRDNVFLNDTGVVAAGAHRDDAVVGASEAAPLGWKEN
jgi:hypothetical protein